WIYAAREIQRATRPEARTLPTYKNIDTLLGSAELREHEFEHDVARFILHGSQESPLKQIREQLSEPTWEQLREAVSKFLLTEKKTAIIAVDSMEQYQIREPKLQATLNGLIRAVASINERSQGVRIIFSLPSEIYAHFFDVSSNPVKDFASVE